VRVRRIRPFRTGREGVVRVKGAVAVWEGAYDDTARVFLCACRVGDDEDVPRAKGVFEVGPSFLLDSQRRVCVLGEGRTVIDGWRESRCGYVYAAGSAGN
jgi:hypothetical protein